MLCRRGMPAGRMRVLAGLGLTAVLAVVVAPAEAGERPRQADLVLHNGEVWADDGRKRSTAVAVDRQRIVAVGSDRRVLRLAGRGTRVVDLRGAFVAPGFRDQHTHLLQTAGAGTAASFYRPTYIPHDPVAAEPGRIALARRHEDIYNAGGTPVDECTRSPVTEQLKQSILVMQEEAARQGVTTAVEAGLRDLGVLDALEKIAPVLAVRGNIDAPVRSIPEALTLDFKGRDRSLLRLLLTHIAVFGPKLRKEVAQLARSERASLVVCGHSHVPFIGEDKGLGVFNPGSIGPRRFQLPIVFGMIEIDRQRVTLRHVDCETGESWRPHAAQNPSSSAH